jgi:hypothetical protein
LDVVTAFLNPEIDDDDIYMTLPGGWHQGPYAPTIVVRLKKALYGLKQAPRLGHNDCNTILLSLQLTQYQADHNLYLRSNGILMLLYLDDLSMLYPQDATKAVIDVQTRLPEKSNITNHGLAHQFLGIEIHREENGIGISLGQKDFITAMHKQFNMQNAHDVSTPLDPNMKLDLAEDQGENKLNNIKAYQAIVGSLLYAALATLPDISFAVTALYKYSSCPFTSHLTAAKESSSISNPQPTFDCTLAAAAALTTIIDSLATQTPIQPIIVPTAYLKDVMYSFPATELSHARLESKISSLCELSKPNTSPAPRAPVKQNGCSSSTVIYMANTRYCSQSIVTIRVHLVRSQL